MPDSSTETENPRDEHTRRRRGMRTRRRRRRRRRRLCRLQGEASAWCNLLFYKNICWVRTEYFTGSMI
jgi:hypothetical protein